MNTMVIGEKELDAIGASLEDKHYYNLQRKRYQWILAQVEKLVPAKGRVADVGAAPGHISMALADLGYKVTAFDFAPEMDIWEASSASFAQNLRSRGATVQHFDFEVENPSSVPVKEYGEFDCVIFTEVLEHIYQYPFSTVRQVANLLKPGGICILTTPNRASLTNRLRGLIGIPVGTALELLKDNFPPHMRHVWMYTPGEVKQILAEAGLSTIDESVHSFHLWTTTISDREVLPYWRPINLKQILKPVLAVGLSVFPSLGEIICNVSRKD